MAIITAVNIASRPATGFAVFCLKLRVFCSEHCRHWFFRGQLIVDGVMSERPLLKMVMATQRHSSDNNVIKFSDNSRFWNALVWQVFQFLLQFRILINLLYVQVYRLFSISFPKYERMFFVFIFCYFTPTSTLFVLQCLYFWYFFHTSLLHEI